MQSEKRQNDLCSFPRQSKQSNHGNPIRIKDLKKKKVYAPISNTEEAEQFYEDLQGLLELKPKNMSFSS